MPRWMLPVLVLGCILVGEVVGLVADDDDEPSTAKTQLTRPDGLPDDDVKGTLKLWSLPERIQLKVKKSDSGDKHKVFMEDDLGSGELAKIGSADDKGNGKWVLDYDASDGEELPFGVTTVDMLSGRMVEVVTGGEVVLFGYVPYFSNDPDIAATTSLVRPVFAPDADATGWVYALSKPAVGIETIEVNVENMSFKNGTTYGVFLETASGSNLFALIGQVAKVKGQKGTGSMEISTSSGDALAFGAGSVVEYEGRQIQVRDALGVAYLVGTLAPLQELP